MSEGGEQDLDQVGGGKGIWSKYMQKINIFKRWHTIEEKRWI